jgi:adenosylcobinamide kinase/adenosylcobinamide-phosphate guanylyltransferase
MPVTYLATGADRPGDGAWQQRLLLHRQRRPSHWTTLEVGGELEAALEQFKLNAMGVSAPTQGQRELTLTIPIPATSRPQDRSTLPFMANGDAALSSANPAPLLLIDSLGTWLAHHLDLEEPAWHERQDRMLAALDQQRSPVVLVCEEVGWGVVPPTAIGGLFRDRSGSLQQRLMQQATAAWLVVQGRALNLMALGEPVPPA